MTTRREFLEAAALGAAAAAAPARPAAAAASQSPGGGAAAIVDWHAHRVGPRVVELLAARPSPRPPQGAGRFDIGARMIFSGNAQRLLTVRRT